MGGFKEAEREERTRLVAVLHEGDQIVDKFFIPLPWLFCLIHFYENILM